MRHDQGAAYAAAGGTVVSRPPDPTGAAPAAADRWRVPRGWRLPLAAAGVFLAVRAACLGLLLVLAGPQDDPLRQVLLGWDGGWYVALVRDGYPRTLPAGPGGIDPSTVAFFPGYPLLAAGIARLGVSELVAALLATLVAGAVAAALVAVLVRQVALRLPAAGGPAVPHPDRVALLAVLLWSAAPPAYVLNLPYSEGLFTALAAGTLLALLHERWLLAGLGALLAGLTRPTGLVLAAAALVAAWPAVRRQRRLRPLVAPLLAPLGTAGYLGFLWAWTGRPDAWFVTEREGWTARFDGGWDFLQQTWRTLGAVLGGRFPPDHPLPNLLVPVMVGVALALLVLAVRDRLPTPLLVYAAGLLVLVVTSAGTYSSGPRFLLPAVPLLVPLARRLAPHPGRAAAVATASLVSMLGFGALVVVLLDPALVAPP